MTDTANEPTHQEALLYLPGYTEPVGTLSFPRNAELSGVRLCVASKMYDAVVTSDKSTLVFEVEPESLQQL